MAQAKQGDTVRVHYTGKLDDGTVFDTSSERSPLEFTIGEGEIIPGFEQAVIGMKPGETKTVRIPPEEAYGPHRDDMTLTVDRDQFPEDLDPEPGQQLQVRQPGGGAVIVTVSEVSESTVTLDANHPLAGRLLTFDIQLLDIVSEQDQSIELC
ncbi:MAG TPA: peptidylprolyl isomerase [Candidatus Methanoculleus thermohydrogenotrophicum]|jgi:peptidylprolyl isomerase|nr:peptidylprolyl isomerase [Candidatus Methanoculleus thermohydrogenotrophicum]NLM82906.1 peptidylprolyl isomerase [Candidatus Methanoculleus thermohydrogenotrophicum]HOB17523.1 peptidylprolyl isomerase [Candidatus Methanoculleus thermohydrogenotrophicum]HPZ37678.1 peptidylprolyl isomerase [Candidatus Methanoculleus thermohydrogenotrophicum]HQC91847.1 peptidylprolyl isomerase [Candidatus Methanoculleus thermohydrogenotrophicum]